MKNTMMEKKEREVKVDDQVYVEGNLGTVTEVVRKDDWTGVRVHFSGFLAEFGQYQDQVYGGYVVK